MIENMFGQSRLNPNPTAQPQPQQQQASAEAASLLQGISSAATMSAALATVQPLQYVSDANTLDGLLSQYKAVAVMFTSATCPPCKIIKPEFIKIIEDKHHQSEGNEIKLLGICADVGSMSLNSRKYGIQSVPTFQFFLNGEKTSEFKGANYAELKSQVDLLLFDAYPRKFVLFYCYDCIDY